MRYSDQLIRYALGIHGEPNVEVQKLDPTPIARMDIDETPTDKKRCSSCRKKLGLTAFSCKCELYFCAIHRPAEEHNCTYNYKGAAKTQLETVMRSAVKDKLERI
jgi:predicted nucleic acid binding AN1-type Zn finger protein